MVTDVFLSISFGDDTTQDYKYHALVLRLCTI